MNGHTVTIETLNEHVDIARKEYKEKTQQYMKETFSSFFHKHPEVTSIGWTQYSPYWNDGKECVFNCHIDCGWCSNAPDPENVMYGEYCGDAEGVWVLDEDYGSTNDTLIPTSVQSSFPSFVRVLGSIDNSIYLDMFGNHAQIIATREGFKVCEFDHD